MEAVAVSKQELRFAENLTLPTVQIVVMSANMSCIHCRQRTARMISRMRGSLDYAVDVCKKEVTFRGLVDLKKRGPGKELRNKLKSKNLKQMLALCGLRI